MITQGELKSLLHYDPLTGHFTNKTRRGRLAPIGGRSGRLTKRGYIRINLRGTLYYAHRLAFLYMDGYFPEHTCDHKNGKRNDNRWSNLRHVTVACNSQNRTTHPKNSTGFLGVTENKRDGNWTAQAMLDGKRIFLGNYPTKLEAALARLTFEVWCPRWVCNEQNNLYIAIKKAFPTFNDRCLGGGND